MAFIETVMEGTDGPTFARRLRERFPLCEIVFLTSDDSFMAEAFALHAGGYIMKPVTREKLTDALVNSRHRTPELPDRPVKVRCFGNFEVFIGDKKLRFSRQKGKELFAYLVCLRGTSATRGEICANLFESSDDKKNLEHLKKAFQSLKKDLSKYDLENVLQHSRNAYSVNTALIKCDYYDYLEQKPDSQNLYRGEFLNQYSWAETYIYHLENYI
jgi:two-component SAPR family response regulator